MFLVIIQTVTIIFIVLYCIGVYERGREVILKITFTPPPPTKYEKYIFLFPLKYYENNSEG